MKSTGIGLSKESFHFIFAMCEHTFWNQDEGRVESEKDIIKSCFHKKENVVSFMS